MLVKWEMPRSPGKKLMDSSFLELSGKIRFVSKYDKRGPLRNCLNGNLFNTREVKNGERGTAYPEEDATSVAVKTQTLVWNTAGVAS
jgi:hypothetical protein